MNNQPETLFKQLAVKTEGPNSFISNMSGSIVLSHSRYDAFKGEGHEQPYTYLGLCTAGGGRTYKFSDSILLDDEWRPGRVGLALPSGPATGFTPAMDALFIAFKLENLPACHGKKLNHDDLVNATKRLFDDKLVSSILIALLHDAEAHGASSAFFEHGLSLALHRLASLSSSTAFPEVSSQKTDDISKVITLIDDRLDEDLSVSELAQVMELGTRTFTRVFKQSTGYTPYKYLTMKRMERAKALLRSHNSVTFTASAVGYENPAKFASAFKRWIGCSPSEWKNNG